MKKSFLILMLLGFVSQGVWAAQSQAEMMTCCDQVAMQMSYGNDKMGDMACHDEKQSCADYCQNALHQSSSLASTNPTFIVPSLSSDNLIGSDHKLTGISIEDIPHPPNA